MNYINAGKRDILIFPKFKEIEKIQAIRNKYDELANIIPPHITIAFPFNLSISNEELKEQLKQILCRYHNDIYEKVLKIPSPSNYIPHITLGTIDEIDTNIDLKETFETTVDNVIVECIGENEESIIEFKIEL